MAQGGKPTLNWLHLVFHFGTEFLQVAEILRRLRRADHLQGGDDPRIHGADMSSEAFDAALKAIREELRTPQELASQLKPHEIKKLRDEWEAEAAYLGEIVWAKY